jgi:peroxiredoxin
VRASIGLIAMLASGALAAEVRVQPFEVQAIGGGAVKWRPGAVTVAVFISAECPMSRDYEDRLAELWREFEGRGVTWLAIAPNVNESDQRVKKMHADAPLPFPIYRDAKLVAADALGARMTPVAMVVDAKGVARYRGAIDDARNVARVKRRWVREALEAVLAGRAVEQSEGRGLGCAIKRR